MDERDGELSDERNPFFLNHWAFDAVAAERVGSVEHEELDFIVTGSFHAAGHGGDVGVGAGADVLHVVDEDVDAFEHFG